MEDFQSLSYLEKINKISLKIANLIKFDPIFFSLSFCSNEFLEDLGGKLTLDSYREYCESAIKSSSGYHIFNIVIPYSEEKHVLNLVKEHINSIHDSYETKILIDSSLDDFYEDQEIQRVLSRYSKVKDHRGLTLSEKIVRHVLANDFLQSHDDFIYFVGDKLETAKYDLTYDINHITRETNRRVQILVDYSMLQKYLPIIKVIQLTPEFRIFSKKTKELVLSNILKEMACSDYYRGPSSSYPNYSALVVDLLFQKIDLFDVIASLENKQSFYI